MTPTSKKKKKQPIIDPDYKPYIVLNDRLQVWVGLLEGGRKVAFSDDFDAAKVLGYEEQFVHICRIADCQVMKDYI
jgi:hypothetical protein